MTTIKKVNDRKEWIKWLENYGIGKFYDVFVKVSQGAESKCQYCNEPIFLDIVEGGGVTDWKLIDGDYGCNQSPETCAEGVGSHKAEGVQ